MSNITYQQTEMKKGDRKVVVEYPVYSQEDDKIKDEVRVILQGMLEEYLKQIL